MSDLITGDFNYASVDPETATKLKYFAKSGKALIRKSQIQFIADLGKLLSEARDVLANHKNGTFIKWATAEFDIEAKTVYRYVNAWDRILCQACHNYLHWSQSALYLASAEDFPKPVMKKLEKIPATDLVRTSDVKRLIEASKPKPSPEPEEEPDDSDAETEAPSDNQADVLDDEGEPDCHQVDDDPAQVESQASIMLDSLGKQIPKNLRSASELAIQLQSIGREVDKYRQAAKDFAEQPGGEWLQLQDIDTAVRALKGYFQGAQFYCVCPKCEGKGCKRCDNTGWLPEHRKNIL
jgi:hypothetical protein